MKVFLYISMVLGSILIGGCEKVVVLPTEAGGPRLTFISISPTTVIEFTDSIIVTYGYNDPDGDIGHENPDELQLQVKDSRLENPDYYHVPLITPSGKALNVEGQLKLIIKNTALLGAGGNETTSYELSMTDRAGNKSNVITTNAITITRE